jgi:8-oxo-dGTP diphosphatase
MKERVRSERIEDVMGLPCLQSRSNISTEMEISMFGKFAALPRRMLNPLGKNPDPLPARGDFRIDLIRKLDPAVDIRTALKGYPDVVVGVVLRRRRVVMVRQITPDGTMWTFPGGKVEEGETHEEAVIRELRKEIGMGCKVVKRIGERLHPITGRTITYIHCKAEGGKPRNLERNKADDIRWLTPQEIDAVTNGTLFDKVRDVIAAEARLKR